MSVPETCPEPAPVREEFHLNRALGPVMLWGLGVGYVISGEYFGWNLGLAQGGTFGLLIAFAIVTVMYVTFVFSYTEMACAIPRAGGVFVYAVRGLGMVGGYLGGIAQVVEFVFAPPAIAIAIGSYAQLWIDPQFAASVRAATSVSLDTWIALLAYVLFTGLNIWGVKQAAVFELCVTVSAVFGLVLFTGVTAPHFRWSNFVANGWPHGWAGAMASIPFAIWFYLAIEGVANVAEEATDPQRDVARGFGGAIATLVVLATCVLFFSVGVGGWERVVYEPSETPVATAAPADAPATSDRPLPLALEQVVVVGIGLLGLFASFNGIILASGRALFEMGRVGFLPYFIGRAHRTTKVPVNALMLNLVVGVGAILFLDTSGLLIMAAFGAVTLYIVSMLALMRLRRVEAELARPYRTPFFPVLPLTALALATFSLATMTYFNLSVRSLPAFATSYSLWYYGFLLAALAYYFAVVRGRLTPEDIAHFHRLD